MRRPTLGRKMSPRTPPRKQRLAAVTRCRCRSASERSPAMTATQRLLRLPLALALTAGLILAQAGAAHATSPDWGPAAR